MDWDQEQAAPKAFVSGPAKIRSSKNGPVRVAVEVSRETAGSRFVQTISFQRETPGKRVEFGNVIDWNTRESNLKATFPLTASNDDGHLQLGHRHHSAAHGGAEEVRSAVASMDRPDRYERRIRRDRCLTDCKNGSDKPNDHTIRLTLIRTPGSDGRLPRPGDAGSRPSRIRLRHRRARGRMARRPD